MIEFGGELHEVPTGPGHRTNFEAFDSPDPAERIAEAEHLLARITLWVLDFKPILPKPKDYNKANGASLFALGNAICDLAADRPRAARHAA